MDYFLHNTLTSWHIEPSCFLLHVSIFSLVPSYVKCVFFSCRLSKVDHLSMLGDLTIEKLGYDTAGSCLAVSSKPTTSGISFRAHLVAESLVTLPGCFRSPVNPVTVADCNLPFAWLFAANSRAGPRSMENSLVGVLRWIESTRVVNPCGMRKRLCTASTAEMRDCAPNYDYNQRVAIHFLTWCFFKGSLEIGFSSERA